MCPLYPVHLVLTYGLAVVVAWAVGGEALMRSLDVGMRKTVRLVVDGAAVEKLSLREGEVKEVTYYLDDLSPEAAAHLVVQAKSADGLDHIELSPQRLNLPSGEEAVEGEFNVTGKLLGFSKIRFVLSNDKDDELVQIQPVEVKVFKGEGTLDKIFIHSIIILVVIVYINMGCAINLQVIKDTLRKPISPIIGLSSQYLFMPLVAFGIGYGLFSDSPELWLGLFLTGCAPGGGASNMWTYLLGGSLDLSVTMTFLSTVFAFAALPLWIYALGRVVFAEGYYGHLPYHNIAALVGGLVVPLGIGLLIKKHFPKCGAALKRMLMPLSLFFIVFVVSFGVYAYFYMFSFFTWKVVIAGMCLPWLGFVFGGVASWACQRSFEDSLAISVETGIQNTGLAIGVLKVALRDFSPLSDIAIVVPVAVATMTPIPLAVVYIVKRVRECFSADRHRGTFDCCDTEEKLSPSTPLSQASLTSSDKHEVV